MSCENKGLFLLKHESQSSLIQSFWFGKALQRAYNEGKTLANINSVNENGEFVNPTEHKETSLSRNVYKLICESFEQRDDAVISCTEYSITSAEIENLEIWVKRSRLLREDITTVDASNCDYPEAVKRLRPMCCAIHQFFINLEPHEFEQSYKENLEWTGCIDRFINCFSLLKSSHPADHNLCLLLLTSSLEHALGDVYLSYSGAKQCPSLLKDLLTTQELKEVFGDAVITLLHILIGPPTSLNLRNVLWHGFAAPGEVPTQYASLLLFITASLSNKLKDAPFSSRVLIRRPLLRLSPCTGEDNSIFPSLEPSSIQEISDLFCASFFIIPSMLPLWLKAVDYFLIQRFDLCIVLLLPQLEHGLRRVFACVNNCPSRALTAESTVLYTTFDEILSPVLQDGSDNLLRQEIGEGHLELLLDVLVHQEGPRIRDHISHGEVNLQEISQESANHILCLCIAFAGLYLYPDKINRVNGDYLFPVSKRICEIARSYKSGFHPVSLARKTVCKLTLSLLKWQDLPNPFADEFSGLESSDKKLSTQIADAMRACKKLITSSSLSEDNVSKLFPLQFDLGKVYTFVEVVVELLNVAQFPTLYRPKEEIEVAVLLRNIAQHGIVISRQICETASVRFEQWQNRQLRQRQRTNYKRLWSQVPLIFVALQFIVIIIIIELLQLPKNRDQSNRNTFIRFLKRCLQCTENMEFLSSTTKNRWDECNTTAKMLVECVEHYYAKRCEVVS